MKKTVQDLRDKFRSWIRAPLSLNYVLVTTLLQVVRERVVQLMHQYSSEKADTEVKSAAKLFHSHITSDLYGDRMTAGPNSEDGCMISIYVKWPNCRKYISSHIYV